MNIELDQKEILFLDHILGQEIGFLQEFHCEVDPYIHKLHSKFKELRG
jgi:hypothetical protein